MTIGFRVGSARFAALGAVALWGVSFVATKAALGAARHPVGARQATPAAASGRPVVGVDGIRGGVLALPETRGDLLILPSTGPAPCSTMEWVTTAPELRESAPPRAW